MYENKLVVFFIAFRQSKEINFSRYFHFNSILFIKIYFYELWNKLKTLKIIQNYLVYFPISEFYILNFKCNEAFNIAFIPVEYLLKLSVSIIDLNFV